jgi:hypothetical protein
MAAAYRVPVHEYLDPGALLTPEQFVELARPAFPAGFPSMFAAVLEEAWRTALGASTLNAGGASGKSQRRRSRQRADLMNAARAWFFSEVAWVPFSFLTVCDYLHLEASLVRTVLTRAIEAQDAAEAWTGLPQPLLSRGTRGARQGKSVLDQWQEIVPLAAHSEK